MPSNPSIRHIFQHNKMFARFPAMCRLCIANSKITFLPTISTWNNSISTVRRFYDGWKNSCSLGMSLTEYPAGATVLDSLWRTMCWNTDNLGCCPAPSENGLYFKKWYDLLTSGTKQMELNIFTTSIRFKLSPLCITSSGLMASVPSTTRLGIVSWS